jgi:5-oxoprolinase (ATP-hydrolysing) subunit A
VATINCDMGEAFGLYRIGDDEGLMPLICLANVACGFHASDFNHMRKTVRLARQHQVKVGAHPSLPDLQGFGRREMKMRREELANCIIYQVGALKAFLDAEGMALNHIKPHGSLYGMAARDETVAHAVCDAADVFKTPIMGMIGTQHEIVYDARGHTLIAEFYADLEYNDDGSLIITSEHEAVDPADAASRCLRAIAEGKSKSITGRDVTVRADSICVHSDTPNAVAVARAVRDALRSL